MRKLMILILSLIGLFDSIYLWWVYTSPSRPLVCLGTGCDVARASAYSHLWGQPLPIFGVLMYGVLVLLAFAENLGGRGLGSAVRTATLVISGAGVLASLGLSGIEAFVLHAWCAWCVASAIGVTLIFALSIYGVATPGIPLDDAAALKSLRRQLVIFISATMVGTVLFIYLKDAGEFASPKPVSSVTLEQRLVRPGSHATGNLQSPVTVVEFGDFECPMCGLAQKSVDKMLAQYGTRIRFVFRQFPVTSIHPQAEKAAEASECAAQQGKFWPADKLFYEKQSNLSVKALENDAGELGLNVQQFDSCLSSGQMASRVQEDVADGKALGVKGTPTFFVGNQPISGPPDYANLSALLNQDLARAGGVPSASPPSRNIPGAATGTAAPASSAPSSGGLGSASPFGGSGSLSALQASSPLACSPDEAKLAQPALIHTAQAKQLFAGNPKAVFVDVREANAFAAGHIAGAVNLPVEDITQKWNTLPKDKVIVFYQGGNRAGSPDDVCALSRAAARAVLAQGFDQARVKVDQDGLKGWKAAGLPVSR